MQQETSGKLKRCPQQNTICTSAQTWRALVIACGACMCVRLYVCVCRGLCLFCFVYGDLLPCVSSPRRCALSFLCNALRLLFCSFSLCVCVCVFRFYFRVSNAMAGQHVMFNILNFSKTRSLFSEGNAPVVRSRKRE